MIQHAAILRPQASEKRGFFRENPSASAFYANILHNERIARKIAMTLFLWFIGEFPD
jgi:hypothetical protein